MMLGIVAQAGTEQFPGLDAKWRHARSPHFEIYSRSSESFARNRLINLETMRAAFFSFLELPDPGPSEITVYAFRSGSQFRSYVSPYFAANTNLIGEYRAFPERDVILLPADVESETTRWVIYANLTKSLLNRQGYAGPSWLNQGLSMFFGNFDASSSRYEIGNVDSMREHLVKNNPQINLAALFNVSEGQMARVDDEDVKSLAQKNANVFHARSWVLLHYWYCGQKEVPAHDVNRFIHFLLVRANAENPDRVRAKFEEIFHCDYHEMERRVEAYMKAGYFPSHKMPLPSRTSESTFTMRTVDELEMRERLAELKLRMQKDSLGRLVMLEALKGPRASRAAEVLGCDAIEEGDDRRAQDYWERALDEGSTNLAVLNLVTRIEYARWFRSYDFYQRLPVEKTVRLRELLDRCLKQYPDQIAYYEMAAWVEATAAEPDIPRVNRVQAKMKPELLTADALISIALVRSRLGDRDSTLELLRAINQFRPTAQQIGFARQVRQILGDAESKPSAE